MERIQVEGFIQEIKPSEVRSEVTYITAEVAGWGKVKFVSTRSHKVGDKVVLRSQKLRARADQIRWEEQK